MFSPASSPAIPIYVVPAHAKDLPADFSPAQRAWVEQTGHHCKTDEIILMPGIDGHLASVLFYKGEEFWDFGALPPKLPEGTYRLEYAFSSKDEAFNACLAWGLSLYHFDQFKHHKKHDVSLVWPEGVDQDRVLLTIETMNMVRDLVNRPANDLNPRTFSQFSGRLAERWGAPCTIISGDDLLEANYPALHAFGDGCDIPSHLVDISWGDESHPKLYIVGKGVCFDSGGLNVKAPTGMRLMKKDMGGAAVALGLAQMIISQKLPVRLRVLLPLIENSISGRALRPGDIIRSRNGKTIEIGHTDAEGRVILSDCLAEAASNDPDLIIDCATLTGAARIALGPDIPALFSNREELAQRLSKISLEALDPLWPLPLWHGYNYMNQTPVADVNNDSKSPYGGAITAALFLEKFVGDHPWIHVDMMAWNAHARPGRPEGGEAQGLRAIYKFLEEKYR